MRLSLDDLRALARSVGFGDNTDVAAAVAMAESGGNPNAIGDMQFGYSHGLWQVNLRWNPTYDPQKLFDQEYNARAAFKISSSGKNWKPWTTYRTGAYLKYMPAGTTPPQEPFSPAPVSWGRAAAYTIIGLGVGYAGMMALKSLRSDAPRMLRNPLDAIPASSRRPNIMIQGRMTNFSHGFGHRWVTSWPPRYVTSEGYNTCDACGRDYDVWMTDDRTWQLLPKSLWDCRLCVPCFRRVFAKRKAA